MIPAGRKANQGSGPGRALGVVKKPLPRPLPGTERGARPPIRLPSPLRGGAGRVLALPSQFRAAMMARVISAVRSRKPPRSRRQLLPLGQPPGRRRLQRCGWAGAVQDSRPSQQVDDRQHQRQRIGAVGSDGVARAAVQGLVDEQSLANVDDAVHVAATPPTAPAPRSLTRVAVQVAHDHDVELLGRELPSCITASCRR